MSIYDDEENLLSQVLVEAWVELDDDTEIENALSEVVTKFDDEDRFGALDLYKPFSISLADENFVVQKELLVIEDDSIVRLENDFMERIDKEFDDERIICSLAMVSINVIYTYKVLKEAFCLIGL